MAKTLLKNRRFKTGNTVKILFNPVTEANSTNIVDSSAGSVFKLTVTLAEDVSAEMFGVGDIAAFGFGAGIVESKSAHQVVVNFPNSAFPDSNVMKYVGSEFQNVLFFKYATDTDNVSPPLQVSKLEESVEIAEFGYSRNIYNTQSETKLVLAPLKRMPDGLLSAIIMSKGYVLKSCDDEDYNNATNGWKPDFPLQLEGSTIDPVFRRASLDKRVIDFSRFSGRTKLTFSLLG